MRIIKRLIDTTSRVMHFKLWMVRLYCVLGQPNYLRWLQWPVLDAMLDVRDESFVLDLGAGNMQYSIWLSKATTAKVVAVDKELTPSHIKLASDHAISCIRADGQVLPFADDSIDRILMSSLLHMVPAPTRLLSECHRVLKPNGFMVLSVPNHYAFIPTIISTAIGKRICKYFEIPISGIDIIQMLNKKFGVGGASGYYSTDELKQLLSKEGFEIIQHRYAPGEIGSLFWECSVLAYIRMGSLVFHLLFLLYPFARACDLLGLRSRRGSEHVVKVAPIQPTC